MKKSLFVLLALLWAVNLIGQLKPDPNPLPYHRDWGKANLWFPPTIRFLPGFNLSGIPAAGSLSIRDNCELLFLNNDVFYISKSNMVCRVHYDGTNWTLNQPLVCTPAAVDVAAYTQLSTNNMNEIYYVGITGANVFNIYVIKLQDQPISSNIIPTAIAPSSLTSLVYHFCQQDQAGQLFYYDQYLTPVLIQQANGQWSGTNLLANANPLKIRIGSKPVVANTDKYYYIAYSTNQSINGKICEVFKWNGSWVAPGVMNVLSENDNPPDLFVAFGEDLQTDGWSLFYVGATYKRINGDYWDNQFGGWKSKFVSPDYMPLASTTNQIVVKDNNVYYVCEQGYVCFLHRMGEVWPGTVLATIDPKNPQTYPFYQHEIAPPDSYFVNGEAFKKVKPGTNLVVWDNPIFEEGTDITFPSHHIYYITEESKIGYAVYDVSYYGNCQPFNNDFCSQCSDAPSQSGPPYKKTWYYLTLFPQSNFLGLPVKSNSFLGARVDPSNQKTTAFLLRDAGMGFSSLWYFDRKANNSKIKPNWNMVYNDEFDDSRTIFGTDNEKKWNPQSPTSSGNWGAYYEYFENPDNTPNTWSYSFNQDPVSGTSFLSLVARRLSQSYKYSTWIWPWSNPRPTNNECTMTLYNMTSGGLQSDWLNCKDPWTLNQQGNTEFCAPAYKNKKFTYKYGYNEFRGRTPRARGVWPTLWSMPAVDLYFYSLNMFEIEGNGRAWLASNFRYPTGEGPGDSHAMYPIGFRYYDDFYTYATDWRQDNVDFYFNNEWQGSLNTNVIDSLGFFGTDGGDLYRTVNHGDTWTKVFHHNVDGGKYKYMKFFNHQEGVILVEDNVGVSLWRTYDAGTIWDHCSFVAPISHINAVCYQTKQHTLVAGNGGKIYDSWDGGLTFSTTPMVLATSTNLDLNAMDFAFHGYTVGNNGLILKFDEVNYIWRNSKPADLSHSNHLYSIQETNFNIAYAAGANGTIYKTTDQGSTWIQQISGTTSNLKFINFLDDNVGCIVGDNGCVLKTTNGGLTWISSTIPGNPDLTSVELVSYTRGYITSRDHHCYITNNGGTTWTINTTVDSPILSLSFPYPHTIPNTEMYILLHNEQSINTAVCEKPLTTETLDADYVRFYSSGNVAISDDDIMQEKSVRLNTSQPKSNELAVYPNPSKGTFTVNLPFMADNVDVTVQNSAGSTVFTCSHTNIDSFVLKLQDKPSGVYLMNIKYDNTSEVVKLVKN